LEGGELVFAFASRQKIENLPVGSLLRAKKSKTFQLDLCFAPNNIENQSVPEDDDHGLWPTQTLLPHCRHSHHPYTTPRPISVTVTRLRAIVYSLLILRYHGKERSAAATAPISDRSPPA